MLVYGTIVQANLRTKNGKQICTYKIDDGTGILSVLHFPINRLGIAFKIYLIIFILQNIFFSDLLSACQQNSTTMNIFHEIKCLINPMTNHKVFINSDLLEIMMKQNILQQNDFKIFKKVLVVGTPYRNRNNEICLKVVFAETNDYIEQTYKKNITDLYNNFYK